MKTATTEKKGRKIIQLHNTLPYFLRNIMIGHSPKRTRLRWGRFRLSHRTECSTHLGCSWMSRHDEFLASDVAGLWNASWSMCRGDVERTCAVEKAGIVPYESLWGNCQSKSCVTSCSKQGWRWGHRPVVVGFFRWWIRVGTSFGHCETTTGKLWPASQTTNWGRLLIGQSLTENKCVTRMCHDHVLELLVRWLVGGFRCYIRSRLRLVLSLRPTLSLSSWSWSAKSGAPWCFYETKNHGVSGLLERRDAFSCR